MSSFGLCIGSLAASLKFTSEGFLPSLELIPELIIPDLADDALIVSFIHLECLPAMRALQFFHSING